MLLFGIESSCDETAAAIVEDGVREIADVLATSAKLHELTGGVVPEVAARKQVEFIVPVIAACLAKANVSPDKIDAIAVTVGPGLVGSLVVGVEAAKALAVAWNKPVIPVNHLVGHIYGNFVSGNASAIVFPAVVLIVSGGHTDLVLMRGHGDLEYIGGTVDDAAGEAFDKVARLLNISRYFGGAAISNLAATCKNNTLQGKFPRPMLHDNTFDFSFSGLKTAVKNFVEQNPLADTAAVAREFETAVVDVLVAKTIAAAKKYNAMSILLAGGVAANTPLRTRLNLDAQNIGIPVFVPPLRLCSDNAVYIASAAFFTSDFHNTPRLLSEIKANPSLGVMDRVY